MYAIILILAFILHRKSPENMILVGVWFGSSHPPVNTFMKPIKESLLALETSGMCIIILLIIF